MKKNNKQNNSLNNNNELDAQRESELFAPDWQKKSLSRTRRRQERERQSRSAPVDEEVVVIEEEPVQETRPAKREEKPRHNRSHKRSIVLPATILTLALVGTSLGASWYLGQHSSGNAVGELYTLEQKQYNDYASSLNTLAKPEGWSDEAFANLKFAALQAYDQTQLNTLSQAMEGNLDAEAQAQSITEVSAQPGIEAFKTLFSQPGSIPVNVVNAAANPDLVDFVMAYPSSAGIDPATAIVAGDITTQMPDTKTFDPNWGYVDYGNGCFALNGAAPTVISDVFSFCLDDPTLTPYRVAQWANEADFALTPVRSADDNIVQAASMQFGVNMNPINNYASLITDQLTYGYPMIIITGSVEDPHFYALDTLDEAGNWVAFDPLSPASPVILNPEETAATLVKAYAFW